MSEKKVHGERLGLHAREAGKGPAILLLHAFPLNSAMWEPQIEEFRGRARLIAPDLPGFGRSAPPAAEPAIEDYANLVLALLDSRGVDRVVVVGLSMGGYLAFRLVERLGDRLAGLLLADTRVTPDTEEGAARRHELAARVEKQGVEVAADEFLPMLLGATTRERRPALIDRVRAIARENHPAGVAGALRAMAKRPDSTPLLSHLRCPVVCVAGEEDALTPPDVARAMAEQIPGGRWVAIPRAGHLTNLEAPEAFNRALAELVDIAR